MLNDQLSAAVSDHSSRLPGFYRLRLAERRAAVARWAGLTPDEAALLDRGLRPAKADALVENAVGTFALPLGIATNFRINGRDVLVPMAVEEPSVIAAASHGALMVRRGDGFVAEADEPVMIGQIHLLDLPDGDLDAAATRIVAARDEILSLANAGSRSLPRLGGGSKDIETRALHDTAVGPVLVVHLLFDTRDAMGANAVNTACENVAPLLEQLSGGRALMRILSNLADRRVARASCRVPAAVLARDGIPGTDVAQRIAAANAVAVADPYRAATHNKGIMNGIDPVVIATGNDWRSAEAGAHAYAARDGTYRALTDWQLDGVGDLLGSIEIPLALGIVGGTTGSHPAAAVGLKILAVSSARELAAAAVCVGLAQNLSALRALVCEGIQPGHMALHARQVAVAAGASGEMAVRIAEQLVAEGQIHTARAKELVAEQT
jgi:hydroxymethylglutaryl-CoA reductase